ncbi:MAG: alpha/beta hydrolase [Phycisphaerales bacterium]|nr:alpha/beta hydrolase [Phycisphaerales bacterium]
MKPIERSAVLFLLALGGCLGGVSGCHRPPVGLYEFRTCKNVEYAKRDTGPLSMDIVVPKGVDQPRPAVLWLHGGAWAGGWRDLMKPICDFTASFGYVSATASYRLIPVGVTFPAPVCDAADAVRFLRSHAEEYNIDPDRIAIGGESAGAHLALLVGLAEELVAKDSSSEVSSAVSAIINIYGPTDMETLYRNASWINRSLVSDFIGCVPETCPGKWVESSPINHIHSDAPPVLVLHGDRDPVVPFSQGQRFYERSRKVGAPVMIGRVKAAGHGWIAHPYRPLCQSTMPLVMRFLSQVFPEPF